jgi:Fe-S-cluster containining protein
MSDSNALPVVESCEGCGACCQSLPAPPYKVIVTADGRMEPSPRGVAADVERLRAAPPEALEIRRLRLESGRNYGPCCWFDQSSRQCGWYEYRPEVCRVFERGSEDCVLVRAYLLPDMDEETNRRRAECDPK